MLLFDECFLQFSYVYQKRKLIPFSDVETED